jgi:DNA-binding MarR family transcriptional regulator
MEGDGVSTGFAAAGYAVTPTPEDCIDMDAPSRPTPPENVALVPLMFRTTVVLTDRMTEGVPPAAAFMTARHATVLLYLSNHDLVTNSELARLLDVTKQAVSELVASLERAGIVRRVPHPVDRRARVLLLTERGEALLADGRRRWYELEDELVALVGSERVAVVREVLQAYLAASGGLDPAAPLSSGARRG